MNCQVYPTRARVLKEVAEDDVSRCVTSIDGTLTSAREPRSWRFSIATNPVCPISRETLANAHETRSGVKTQCCIGDRIGILTERLDLMFPVG